MASKRPKRGVGQVHKTSEQEPECQHEKGDERCEHDACKPDFDEKDSNISPRRKAPGPDKEPRNRSEDSDDDTELPARKPKRKKTPEAEIHEDLPAESGKGS